MTRRYRNPRFHKFIFNGRAIRSQHWFASYDLPPREALYAKVWWYYNQSF